jgi:transposase
MHCVGIDLHRTRSHIAVIDEQGEQLWSRRIINDAQTFLTLLEGVGECRVALEATYGWEWLADVLQDAGYELHLAHPMRTKATPLRGSRQTPLTRARWRTSCAPTCSQRPTSPRASCATCAICCVTAWR